MTYSQVLVAVQELVASGNFTYLKYMELVSQNWLSFASWVFSYTVVWNCIIFGTIGFVKYIKVVSKAIKEEVEG